MQASSTNLANRCAEVARRVHGGGGAAAAAIAAAAPLVRTSAGLPSPAAASLLTLEAAMAVGDTRVLLRARYCAGAADQPPCPLSLLFWV
eukprot:scaffold71872_cov14-Tisochrysis_lutea.AAC.1